MKIKMHNNPEQADKDYLMNGLMAANTENGMPEKENCWIFAYNDAGQKVGGCLVLLFPIVAWIDMIWIDKAYRGQGIGKELLQVAEKEAQQKGCMVAALDTFAFQKAVPFYEKCGYHVTSAVEALNGNDERYFMKKRL